MKLKKTLCLILAVLLALFGSSFSTVALAANGDYPEGVTKELADNAVVGTEKLVAYLVTDLMGVSLKQLIDPMIYSDATASAILVSIYGALEANASELEAIGVNVSLNSVANALSGYPEVQNALLEAGSFSEADLSTAKWGITNKTTFARAVSTMLSPFNSILYMLLCSGRLTIMDFIKVDGSNGYENAIAPMLSALGCEVGLSQAEFKEQAQKDKNSMVYNILVSALGIVDELEKAPIDTLVTLLPKFAFLSESGKMNEYMQSLLSPILDNPLIKIAGLLGLIDLSTLEMDAEAMLNNALTEMSAESGLKLPPIDFAPLSTCTTDGVNVDKGKAYVIIMSYLVEALKLNKDNLPKLIEEMNVGANAIEIPDDMLNNLLSKETDDIVKMIVLLFNESKISPATAYQFPQISFLEVAYTENLTKKNYERVLDGIDDLIDEFVAEYSDYNKLEPMLKNTIYTNFNVTSFMKSIYGALEKEGFLSMLSILGVDASPKGVARLLTEGKFSNAKATLSKYSSWDKVNENSVTWGFYNGSRNGFEDAFVASLRPLFPLLRVVLAGESITVMNSIKLNGADGYNTAVIPILEALGCKNSSIDDYDKYKRNAKGDDVLKAITTPVFDLLDDLFKKPVKTALEILPNAIYFIDSGNLEVCLNNLMRPIAALTEKMSPVIEMSFDTSSLTASLSTDEILKAAEAELGIKLKALDLKTLYSFGEMKTKTSKSTIDGKKQTYSYIESDETAVLITILRYLVDTLKLPENKGMLEGMMSGGGADSFSLYASQIFTQFEGMTTDQIIEWLYNLLFKERAIVPLDEGETYNPTIIYEEEPINYTPFYIAGGVVLFGAIVGLVYYLNRKKLYY